MKKINGFTIIELVLVILLIGLISGFVGGILVKETDFLKLLVPRKEAKLEGKLIIERLKRELREAYQNSYNSGSNVKFKIPYQVFKGYTSVMINLSGDKLYLTTDNNQSVIGSSIVYFNLTSLKWSPQRDFVRLTIKYNKDGQIIEQIGEVYLRNTR